ncbi:carbonic anhydrase [Orrella marina]|uniref:Carbonic anhydrase n=1 Tax=Orrella marina TaxID=2163011 RepID=A0A2R4XN38_9BURK|nr:carbonic anhydrase [Orrella marina]AWB35226.1 carbonic anhydrase [Orrella marina]
MSRHDLEKFIAGFAAFQKTYFDEKHELFEDLAQGQHPRSLLIGCCDSRVDPSQMMGADPGEIFVSRNVANLVPPCEPSGHGHHGVSAAIQFAVQSLKVERVIVLGHSRCGGIRALMESVDTPEPALLDFVGSWVRIAEPARRKTLAAYGHTPFETQCRICEKTSILNSLNNLMTFPWVRDAVEHGRLTLHGWYFDLERGELLAYSDRAGQFLPVVCALENTASPGTVEPGTRTT